MVQDRGLGHRKPLEGCACLGYKGSNIEAKTTASLLSINDVFASEGQVYDCLYILVSF